MRGRTRIAAWLGLGQLLGRGTLALYTIVMVRELSRTGYGEFAYAIALAGIWVSLADAGFSRLVIRDVARANRSHPLVRAMLLVRSAAALAVTAIFLATTKAGLFSLDGWFAAAVGAYVLLESLSAGYEAAAVGAERPLRFVVGQAASAVTLCIAAAVVASQDAPTPSAAVTGLMTASLVRVVVGQFVWRSRREVPRMPLRALQTAEWLRQALPFLGLAVLGAIHYRIGVVILYALDGPGDTAPFAAALRVFDAVAVLALVAFSTLSPVMSRAHAEQPHMLWSLWLAALRRIGPFAVVGAAAIAAFGSEIASLLFGPAYEVQTGRALELLAPGMALLVLQSLTAAVVLMADDRRWVLGLTAGNATVAVVFGLVLSARFGADGAAVATSFAELASFATFALLIRSRYGSTTAKDAGKSDAVSRITGIPQL